MSQERGGGDAIPNGGSDSLWPFPHDLRAYVLHGIFQLDLFRDRMHFGPSVTRKVPAGISVP
jgi:hypothetical protein